MTPSVKNQFIFFLLVMLLPFENYACNSKQPPPPAKESSEESTSVEAYVINGQSSQPGEFPHQVALHPATSNATFCGGSIICPHLILTAAHCLDDMPPKFIKITAGLTDMSLLGKGNEQSRNVGFIYIHEKYEIDSKVNDIAIIELDSPLAFNTNVNKINLPKLNETFKGDVTITGWGMTEQKNEQSYSNELKKVKLRIVSNEKCKKLYPKSRFPVTENNLCAGVKDSGMCNGDSGGPAICRRSGVTSRSNDNEGLVLCGITSFGNSKCGESPGVCTRVASYINWIEEAENDLKTARQIVENGIRINPAVGNPGIPLHKAVLINSKAIAVNVMKRLIKMGADVLAEDSEGNIFLHRLVESGSNISSNQFEEVVEYLVSRSLSYLFNIRENNFGRTPLMLAAKIVKLDMATISLLKENGVDLTLVDKNGESYISYYLSRSGSIKLKHDNLMKAIEAMDLDSVKVLVMLGADLTETNSKSETPLHLAAALKDKSFAINLIKFLIDSGADIDAMDRDDYIFLHRLVDYGSTISPTQYQDMAAFLISKNMSRLYNTPYQFQGTPFALAVTQLDIETATLHLLKNNGVNFNAVTAIGESVLYVATSHNRTLKLVSDLVALGANPNYLSNKEDSFSRTRPILSRTLSNKSSMLHAAALACNVELVKYFLDLGLDVNAQNENGETPLHHALYSYSHNIFMTVKFLLNNGANSEIKDKDGESPPEMVKEHPENFWDADKISHCFLLGSSC